MTDGLVVDYKYNGSWKHTEFIVTHNLNDAAPQEIINFFFVDYVARNDKNHEIQKDNIACICRIINWNKGIKELERISSSCGAAGAKGHLTMAIVPNEDLFKEWLRPEVLH